MSPEEWTPAEPEEIIAIFSGMLRAATGDGAAKRRVGEKPSWKVDGSHWPAANRHIEAWQAGEIMDKDSGAHPLVHTAWRLLALVWQEENDIEKPCSHCRRSLPLSAYGKARGRNMAFARRHECRECRHRYIVNRKYGVDYTEMLNAQGGRCAICLEKPKGKRLAVDHDHQTGQARGLLCEGCNQALGLLHDSVPRLLQAAAYLSEQETNAAR